MMAGTAKKTDPALWERVKAEVTKGDKGGDPGEWSARKAQMAVQQYKKAGGGYEGSKAKDNHLSQWTREEWGTESGKASGETGERYLPKDARAKLTEEEYARTTAKKRRDTRAGKQFSAQPKDVAAKTVTAREAAGKDSTAKTARRASSGTPKLGEAAKSAGATPTRKAADGPGKPAATRKAAPPRDSAKPASERKAPTVARDSESGKGKGKGR